MRGNESSHMTSYQLVIAFMWLGLVWFVCFTSVSAQCRLIGRGIEANDPELLPTHFDKVIWGLFCALGIESRTHHGLY